MRQSKTFIPTLRETPADADLKSHQLLLRAGYIRQNTSGVYSYLPLAKKMLTKIETIVREEMDVIGGWEVLIPSFLSVESWQETGRRYTYGPVLMIFQDRYGPAFASGPIHQEMMTLLLRSKAKF